MADVAKVPLGALSVLNGTFATSLMPRTRLSHTRRVQSYVDAGFDEVYVAQIGPRQEEFFQFWQDKVAPRL